MLYVIYALDHADSYDLRVSTRPAHLARLTTLQNEGRLLLAGPMPAADVPEINSEIGAAGSVIIAEFESLEEARLWASQDPYTLTGVYADIKVQPFLQVFPSSDPKIVGK